ncbi:GIY-YIG nuclease family protein [Curtobacterium sp. MCSS17_016]|uniref:GIY-YIG nuclease family protein n=1 Tax=Curtobacterium sp. MCSS17_016 TaxID=2175644 RepID=UPI0015E8A897|nr:hypothetical protein [Curtobacterium sp. MCSS17_016]WIE81297.1 hypothetical protein DEJ19_018865 [Curtobacterium sp. MCSS17_016]
MTLDPAVDAVRTLTDLARRTRSRGGAQEPIDFAAEAASVLTAVAANVGGVEQLLAGRPGSWEADLIRQLIAGTVPADMLADERVPDGPHGYHWRTVIDADRYTPEELRQDYTLIPRDPGVYCWFRNGEPVYAGRAASGGGLRKRLGQHLDTGTDLSHSTFRAWVAVTELGLTRKAARDRSTGVTAEQASAVTAWVDGCEVGWVPAASASEAKRFEHGLLYAWTPPLNDD